MSASDPPSSDRKTQRLDDLAQHEIESLSLQLDAQLSQGEQLDRNDWLKLIEQLPEEQQQALRARINSLVRKVPAAQPGSSPAGEALDDSQQPPNHSFSDSIVESPATRDTDTQFGTGEFNQLSQKLGSYTLLHELGRGGMGVVYRARHAERGDVVALKVLPNVDGASLHRFKREFRSLADISHPNLVGLRTLENSAGAWFFTMDLVENARSFRSFVRPSGQLDESRLRRSLMQLAEGVHALHQRKVLHRDLKPSNVLVDATGRVIIMDFGLVRELGRSDQTVTAHDISGTPAYMAPETAGGGEETFACDWYAVGVMLYEALSGQLPFGGDSRQVLSDKRSRAAPELAANEHIPDDLRQVCMRLLEREPSRRAGYQDLTDSVGETVAVEETPRQSADALLGRNWQLSSLRNQYDKVQATQRPIVALVSGKSGEGKTALIARFLADLRSTEDVVVLAGRCYDRESVPFKALDSLIDALASFLRTMDTADSSILLPDDTGFLARVFPILGRVEVVARRPAPFLKGLDDQQVRKRAFAALRELLRRVCLQSQVVLVSDDLQWGDADSAEVLFDVLSAQDAPKLLFIGSFRSDEADESHFLSAWRRFQQQAEQAIDLVDLPIGPLSLEHCVALVAHRIHSDDSGLCHKLGAELFAETNGNAFFLSELLDCLDADSHKLQRIPLAQVIAQKLSALPAEASDLLHIVAVSGQALNAAEAVQAIGGSPTAYATLSHMRNARLVRSLGEEHHPRIDTYHDKIRETVLSRLDQRTRRDKHRELLQVIESSPSATEARIYDLAYHADACQDQQRAQRYALLAAGQAREQLSPGVAVQQYEIAYRNSATGLNEPGSYEFAEGYVHCLLLIGRYSEAQKILDESNGCTGDAVELARFEELRGEIAFKLAQLQVSFAHLQKGLALVGLNIPKTLVGLAWGIGWQFTVNWFSAMLPTRPNLQPCSPRVKMATRLLTRIATTAAFTDGTMMVWSSLRGINLARGYQISSELAFSYTIYSGATGALGLHSISNRNSQRSLNLYTELDDEWGVGHAKTWGGINAYARADYVRSVEMLQSATSILIKVGDEWDVDIGLFHLACSLFQLGRLNEAIEAAHHAFERSRLYHDTRTHCSLYLLSKASEGMVEFDSYEQRMIRAPEDILATCNFFKGASIWHLANGRYEEAIRYANLACELPLKHRLPNYHAAAGLPVALAARRRYAESLARDTPEYARAIRSAQKLASRAALIFRFFPVDYPFALRECGEVCRLRGRNKQALKCFERSIRAAERQSAGYELAKSQLARATLRKTLLKPGADAELAQAEAEIARYSALISKGLAAIRKADRSNA